MVDPRPEADPACVPEGGLPAGLGVRGVAFATDLAMVLLAVWGAKWLLSLSGTYLPLELSVVLSFPAYSAVLTAQFGGTVGKLLLGLRVEAETDNLILRLVFREAIAKLVAALPLGAGLWWIQRSRQRRGWHDALSGTRVVRSATGGKFGAAYGYMGLTFWLLLVLHKAAPAVRLYLEADELTPVTRSRLAYEERSKDSLVDVADLTEADREELSAWLRLNHEAPLDFAVSVAAEHQLTLFGELHWVRGNLRFLNEAIPRLYYEAGITCIVMESMTPAANRRLESLVTADVFDTDVALEIAREHPWRAWGWKGYWDVLEAVWRVNQGRPEGRRLLRVVGGLVDFDGPSIAMIGLGEFTTPSAPWEKLRAPLPLAQILLYHDRFDHAYASYVVTEVFEKDERAVWWGGASHTRIHQRFPHGIDGRLVRTSDRMGYLLHERYPGKVAQIHMHTENLGGSLLLSDLVEACALEAASGGVGFQVASSPFALLRDSTAAHFLLQPGLALEDITPRYIVLDRIAAQTRCEWWDSYITTEMLGRYRPYYEAKVGQPLADATEANRAFSRYTGW